MLAADTNSFTYMIKVHPDGVGGQKDCSGGQRVSGRSAGNGEVGWGGGSMGS